MINAKQEFPAMYGEVRCSIIEYVGNEKSFLLKEYHTQEEFNNFLNLLDFEYDDGYGSQELFGTIWMNDGTYFNRHEYDGSEMWEINRLPEIPEILQDKQRERNIKLTEILK